MATQEQEAEKKGQDSQEQEVNQAENAATDSENTDNSAENETAAADASAEQPAQEELSNEELLQQKVNELNDKYLRIYSEFENYRKRTQKERFELLKSAGEETITAMLPVLDDFERAIKSNEESEDVAAIKEGVQLVFNKLHATLTQKGLKEIEAMEQDFDLDHHEALTKIPAPNKKLKGKVVDVLEKGYFLNDKVIRYAKVVIGE